MAVSAAWPASVAICSLYLIHSSETLLTVTPSPAIDGPNKSAVASS